MIARFARWGGRFLLRHPRLQPRVHRIVHRGDRACWVCAMSWAYFESLPGFNDGLRQAEADLAAGRTTRYRYASRDE